MFLPFQDLGNEEHEELRPAQGCVRSSIVVKGLDEVGQNLGLKRSGMWLLSNSDLGKSWEN